MKTYIIFIIFCIFFYSKANATPLENNPLLGTWTFVDNESERESDCFTIYRFEFQECSEFSYWNDIGTFSTGYISIRRLIFKGIFNYNLESREIIIHIGENKEDTLKMTIIELTNYNLSVTDEGGDRMDFQRKE